ncbi:pentapeptide repeat-containing protein [Rhodospirillum sp. A1_3_36]|uniref:phosphorylase family protein n=1 Tax=Rhodospirillum sp. A1_3_36 TaxID=3391666 RepID=UPI0039A6CF2A
MPELNAYFAKRAAANLDVTGALKKHLDALLALMEENGHITVGRVHGDLFSLATPASANAQLNRLIKQINDAAEGQSLPLRLEITQDKKRGSQRELWFEGPTPGPALAHTGDINAVPEDRFLDDQRGLDFDAPDVVLLTFNEHETKAALTAFHPQGPAPTDTRDGVPYFRLGRHGGMSILLRVSEQGPQETHAAVGEAIRHWAPRTIIALGIAFGMGGKQAIGDVLVSTAVRDYDMGRMNEDGTETARGHRNQASPVLVGRFRSLDHAMLAQPDCALHWPKLRFGVILSGSKLVDSKSFKDKLRAIEPEAVGGEMEGVGLMAAALRRQSDWIVVKAICDWGENKSNPRKEQDQAMAAKHAALVVKAALDMGPLHDGSPPRPDPNDPRPRKRGPRPRAPMHLYDGEAIPEELFILDAEGSHTSFLKDEIRAHRGAGTEGVKVLDALRAWTVEKTAPPLFALLGEYGMGKTVTCQKLAQEMDAARKADPTRPLPLYFDLRHITGLDKRTPDLREALEECMRRGWATDGDEAYTLENVFTWMEQGAVVFLDGLDEVLVKLKEADGQIFTNGLLKLIPDHTARIRDKAGAAPARVVVTCRTQYFRTLRDQKTHFTGQERGEVTADRYRALVLLPLSEEQVAKYLASALKVEDADLTRIMDTVRSVHDLEDLTQRPFTLKLVSDFIPDIEEERLGGRPVHGVTLYRKMVRRWLDRDQGKHRIEPDHKMHLAAHLAATLWRDKNAGLPAGELEDWFLDWLDENPKLRRHYQWNESIGLDQLKEDLRTATFLRRVEENEDEDGGTFRFAHTSLQEFFLASYLYDAQKADQPDRWVLPTPSPETLDFLGQMLAEDPAPLATLDRWVPLRRPPVNETILTYANRAVRRALPCPRLRGLSLTEAELDDGVFGTADHPLDLTGADFSGAHLRRTRFPGTRLVEADFSNAHLAQAELEDADLTGAHLDGASLSATVFRSCDMTETTWENARGLRPHVIHGRNFPQTPDTATLTPVIAPTPGPPPPAARLFWLATGPVQCCAFSPDGRRLLSGGEDGTLRLWNAETGRILSAIEHGTRIQSCAFSPDGRRLISGGDDGTLRLWDAETGRALSAMEHGDWITSCAFSPDGRRLISGGDDGTLRLWEAETGRLLSAMNNSIWIDSCAFSPDGRRLISGGRDGTLRLWDTETGCLLSTMKHGESILSCAFSPDGRRLLSVGNDGTLKLWEAETGRLLSTMKHGEWILSCAFSPDGRHLLSGGRGGALCLWDIETGRLLSTFEQDGPIWSCAFSPDGRHLLSGGFDGTLKLWEAETGRLLRHSQKDRNLLSSCTFSPNGRRLLSGGKDGILRLWDAEAGRLLSIRKHGTWINSCAFAPDGRRLLSAGDDSLKLWKSETGHLLSTMEHDTSINTCAVSPDGRRLLSGGEDGTLRIWEVETGHLLSAMEHGPGINSCAVSPDGRRVLSGGGGTLRLWDAKTGRVLSTMEQGRSISSCAFAPDGRHLLSSGFDGSLRLWETATGRLFSAMKHGAGITSCAFSPDGRRLLSGGTHGTLRLWDAETGRTLSDTMKHGTSIISCAFSPDGRRLLSAGNDGTLKLWEAETGRLLRVHGVSETGGHAVWEPEGMRVIEAAGDGRSLLSWVVEGAPEVLPLEYYGPIPAPVVPANAGTQGGNQ